MSLAKTKPYTTIPSLDKIFNQLIRLSKKSFVGFPMARDLSRLRRSRSAASRPNKVRSARQEVDLQQVYQLISFLKNDTLF